MTCKLYDIIGCQLDADSDRFLISSHWATLNVFMYLPKEMELQVRRTVTDVLDINVIKEVQSQYAQNYTWPIN